MFNLGIYSSTMDNALILVFMFVISSSSPSVNGVQIYIKVQGEYIAIPGDYAITPTTHTAESQPARSRRSLETGTVNVGGSLVQKTQAEVFALYTNLADDPVERRKVLAPTDQYSTGYCEVRETITWPARCYPTGGGTMHICRSNARGVIELRGSSCNQDINVMDLFLNSSKRRR